jgi:hypothetical protein
MHRLSLCICQRFFNLTRNYRLIRYSIHSSPESGETTQGGHIQAKLKSKPNDIERRLKSPSIRETSRSNTRCPFPTISSPECAQSRYLVAKPHSWVSIAEPQFDKKNCLVSSNVHFFAMFRKVKTVAQIQVFPEPHKLHMSGMLTSLLTIRSWAVNGVQANIFTFSSSTTWHVQLKSLISWEQMTYYLQDEA